MQKLQEKIDDIDEMKNMFAQLPPEEQKDIMEYFLFLVKYDKEYFSASKEDTTVEKSRERYNGWLENRKFKAVTE